MILAALNVAASASSLSVVISPSDIDELVSSGSGTTVSTLTAAPSGGVAPYTVLWSKFSGSIGLTPTSPTSLTTAFDWTGLLAGNSKSIVAKATITDAVAVTMDAYVDVTVVR